MLQQLKKNQKPKNNTLEFIEQHTMNLLKPKVKPKLFISLKFLFSLSEKDLNVSFPFTLQSRDFSVFKASSHEHFCILSGHTWALCNRI